MGSKKEEERNEKIIRGLMKLPPNRKCINCNSLGPQYVCTNFWTFVCMTCSGIHREFTHRVKSVSMAKFSSQEVESLQNGGNQRSREIYLKDWDVQRQRLPDSSNVDKVREFIKNVYIDRKYAGGKSSDKPPRDGQSLSSPEEEIRRASSYHSYSQSPPYDYQYEDRRYGKQSAVLTRKPGSDRGLDGKLSRWFSNDGTGSRVLDCSLSTGGTQSPSYQKDSGFSIPPAYGLRNMSNLDVLPQNSPDGIPRPQRTASLGSVGSFDSNTTTLNSFNSSNLVDVSESEQNLWPFQDKVPSFSQPSLPGGPDNVDLFKAPVLQDSVSSGPPPIDLFPQPASSLMPVDLFQPSVEYQAQPVNVLQPPQSSQPLSLNFFALQQPADSARTVNTISVELSIPKNDGWATFDTQPAAFCSGTENLTIAEVAIKNEGSIGQFDPVSSFDMGEQWASFQYSDGHESSSMSDPWHESLSSVQAPAAATYTEDVKESSEQVKALNPSSATDKFKNNIDKGGLERAVQYDGPDIPIIHSHVMGTSYVPQGLTEKVCLGETLSHAADYKSTNPFDIPDDSELEHSNMFLDMRSLQATLPPTFLHVTESWFPENPVTPYIPAVQQGGLAYLASQAPNSTIKNVLTQGPVASVGGNPFA